METKEVVLPSGAFARLRNVLWRDRVIANGAAQGNTEMYFVHLVTRVVTIDEKEVTLDQALNLDLREADALIAALVPLLTGPMKAPTAIGPIPGAAPEGNSGV
jgi:hypothetical protein